MHPPTHHSEAHLGSDDFVSTWPLSGFICPSVAAHWTSAAQHLSTTEPRQRWGWFLAQPPQNESLSGCWEGWGLGVVGFWLGGVALPLRVLGGILGQPGHIVQEVWGQEEARLWQVWLWEMEGSSRTYCYTLLLQDAMPLAHCHAVIHSYKASIYESRRDLEWYCALTWHGCRCWELTFSWSKQSHAKI